MIRTIYKIALTDLPEHLQPMHGTLEFEGDVIVDMINEGITGEEILGQWEWDGRGQLIELVPLSEDLLNHLPDTVVYDEEGEIVETLPPVLHLPVELSGWPSYTTALPPDIEVVRQARIDYINTVYASKLVPNENAYPSLERESWDKQVAEAKALIADPDAITPWIDGAAMGRQMSRGELANRILNNDETYGPLHGYLSGVRQRLVGEIKEATTIAEIDAIVWPEVE